MQYRNNYNNSLTRESKVEAIPFNNWVLNQVKHIKTIIIISPKPYLQSRCLSFALSLVKL